MTLTPAYARSLIGTRWVHASSQKLRRESRLLIEMGAHVNSMTLGPEILLANELSMAVIAAGIVHVPSAGFDEQVSVKASLEHVDFSPLIDCFLRACDPLTPCSTSMYYP